MIIFAAFFKFNHHFTNEKTDLFSYILRNMRIISYFL